MTTAQAHESQGDEAQTVTGPAETTADKTGVISKTADTNDEKVYAPSANPSAAVAGVFVGLALLGLAVVAVRDLLVRVGWVDGEEWLHTTAVQIAGLQWWDWMWAAAIGSVLVGGLLVLSALRPRRRTHVSLAGYEVLWTRRGDVARRCSTAVLAEPGVEHATTVVGRRRVALTVTAARPDAVDTDVLRSIVDGVLADLDRRPRVKIRVVARDRGDRR
ncbi:hypothetical protein [Gordonia soli]|uniref:Alkaline shock response membrane anchor protein AmaP n=1 Tax=Gordonia soli NBRC 108243 TaxID=1223545 RepID=M0QDS1_9ACTN|nr:hypothetical protein [Gordonia soli]GAC66461.1 hypothetical protein GS4_02_01720 [Gordonia soli NBRC 108243]